MSARIETLPVRVNKRPWMPWVVATIALAVIAAGVGSYLMLRSSSLERSPAVTRTAPAPAAVTPVIPPQPVATPAGPRIPELAGTDVRTAGGAGSISQQPVRLGSRDGPGLSEPDCAGGIRGGPC
jgi:hypothetical protein